MSAVVVDTNVPKTTNGEALQAGPSCVLACVDALTDVREKYIVLLDDQQHILGEYMASGPSFAGRPGVGNAFFKWVFDNQANDAHCEKVAITPTRDNGESFAEFPNDSDLVGFDRDDRKFVAVALASQRDPPVLNATDTDWWDYRQALERNGVRIRFLCPEAMRGGR